jgi:NAD(P)-dependent dehydrogenase (short-subunit alcohol dehydrogenase family)
MSRKVALVTGGSRGIGLGIARQLANQGFDLAINGMRPEEQVAEVLNELRELGAKVIYVPGDIGSAEARASMVDAVRQAFGRLNWLVNNAGVAPKERLDLLETTEESFNYVVGTNLAGAFFLSQLVANWMVEQKGADSGFTGGIINVSSISATVVSTNRGEYCIAKAGLSMATQLFAARLGEYDLPVYEVRPGVTKTDMTSGVTEKYDKLIADGLCVTPRWGFPEDVGKAVGALADSAFPYSTGQVIMVDGGLTIPRL